MRAVLLKVPCRLYSASTKVPLMARHIKKMRKKKTLKNIQQKRKYSVGFVVF